MLYIALLAGLLSLFSCWTRILLAAPSAWYLDTRGATSALDSFIAYEQPIALQGVLNNIGVEGKGTGVDPGVIIASPSTDDPDYFYTWTRDSALTAKMLIEAFIAGDTSLRPRIEDYISAQAILQTVASLSGDLSDGSGLGEPKFEVNSTAFTGPWGRPQRDGPALRATALITYSQWLLSNGDESRVISKIWPIISNDLSYVGQYWNQTGFDLWEEVDGSSFFTVAVQHRALVEGQAFAQQIGTDCAACRTQAPEVLCFLQSFWNGGFVTSNINDHNSRNGRDANSILASIHTFDPDTGCDDLTFQPCSSRALANHKAVTDSFRPLYAINSGRAPGAAAAVGRYTEDVYYGGNPWYLCTLAAAEQLYDAVYQINRAGTLVIDAISLPFFRDLDPSVAIGVYPASSPVHSNITAAMRNYADEYVSVVQEFTPPDGSLAEQYSRDDGSPISAVALTWSYASFLTATARRSSVVPNSWGASKAGTPPATCSGTSAQGTYAPAPIDCTSSASNVAVTFDVREPTIYGETVFVYGSDAALGNWDASKGLELQAYRYTSSNPLWSGTARSVAAGSSFQYKYYKTGTDGVTVEYEGGANRTFTVPEGCARNVVQVDTWQE
ncbi:MAG: hypothetical protein L6R42_000808 [Xanthoria sp. 1 TBL-2021]|nr:MAG: hypothetical protein L6R42_000808 [Xanthoria sp. 1 TBL-2021]